MKINANFQAINKYCLKYNLQPNSDLSYWLQFGFPKEIKTIEIEDYTTAIASQTKKSSSKELRLDTVITFGKYKGFKMFSIIEGNINYAKWLINIWEDKVSDEVSRKIFKPNILKSLLD